MLFVVVKSLRFEETKVEEFKMSRMKRRSGIVDGGLAISNEVIHATQSSESIRYREWHRK